MKRTASLVLLLAVSMLAACASPTAPTAVNPCASGSVRSSISIHCVLPLDTAKV